MRQTQRYLLWFIMALALFSLWVVWPQRPSNYLPSFIPWPERGWIRFQMGDFVFERRGMVLGLDLRGGTHLVLEADLSGVEASERSNAMSGVAHVLERRINAYGVAETLVSQQGESRIVVQLPGVRNIDEAKALIGKTAQLDFRECVPLDLGADETADEATPGPPPTCLYFDEAGDVQPGRWVVATAIGSGGVVKELTGRYFKPNAALVLDPQTSRPQVAFEFDDEGSRLFEQITTRLIGKPLGIFLDAEIISAPIVQDVISQRGVITGIDVNEARLLAIQLNAGALPVPIKIVGEQTVDATLGADSIRKSILAGEIGMVVVLFFMVLYYRLPGAVAGLALIVYTLMVLALFKLIPVTLTLAGIAAFILSVGMAVDANVLIFERLKEELRGGRPLTDAIERGFDRAWLSIRDSNVSTFITCIILYWFGQNFGASLVMGFALTLFIGVAVSMFTAIVVTRTFMRYMVRMGLAKDLRLFGL